MATKKKDRAADLRAQIEETQRELDEAHNLDAGLMATSAKIAGLNERYFSLKTQLAEHEAENGPINDRSRQLRAARNYSKTATEWALAHRGASKQIRDDLLPKIIAALNNQNEGGAALKDLA